MRVRNCLPVLLGLFLLPPVWRWFNAVNRETWGTVCGVVEFFESAPFASLFAVAILLWLLSLRFK